MFCRRVYGALNVKESQDKELGITFVYVVGCHAVDGITMLRTFYLNVMMYLLLLVAYSWHAEVCKPEKTGAGYSLTPPPPNTTLNSSKAFCCSSSLQLSM